MPEAPVTSYDGYAHRYGDVSVKEYLMDTINERDRKYEQRFAAIDKTITELNESIKDALKAALTSTSEALDKATANTRDALATANDNIKAARDTLASQQDTFARKAEIEQAITAMKEAVTKAELATEKRFDSVNEFRAQMGDMQALLVRKSEVDIRFDSLEKRLDTAVATLQRSEGIHAGAAENVRARQAGVGMVIGIVGSALGVLGFIAVLTLGVVNLVKTAAPPDGEHLTAVAGTAAKVDELLRAMQARDRDMDTRLSVIEREKAR